MIDLEFRKQSARLNRCPRPLPEIGDSVLYHSLPGLLSTLLSSLARFASAET